MRYVIKTEAPLRIENFKSDGFMSIEVVDNTWYETKPFLTKRTKFFGFKYHECPICHMTYGEEPKFCQECGTRNGNFL